jgi:hypothetical protein
VKFVASSDPILSYVSWATEILIVLFPAMPLYFGGLLIRRFVPFRWPRVTMICLLGVAGFIWLCFAGFYGAMGDAFNGSSSGTDYELLGILSLTLWPLLVLLAVRMVWQMKKGPVLPRFLRIQGPARPAGRQDNTPDPW